MMNPEFKRNLWLGFSKHKLIAMPVLLGLGTLALVVPDHAPGRIAHSLYSSAVTAFMFIVWLWGARNANLSIVDELRDKTWDQQRMSALNPWAMTWGKLLGSTAFNWYGGAICLAIALPAALYAGDRAWMIDLPTLIAGGLLLHAALIALNLHTGQMEMQLIQRGGLGWIAIIFALIAFQIINSDYIMDREVTWWGTKAPYRLFLLVSTALFAACAIFAAWRVVSNALQVRTMPWAWPLLALILTGYFAGVSGAAIDHPLSVIGRLGLIVTAIMTYGTLFTEPARLPDWDMLRLRQQRNDWRGWLQHLPLWPTTLLLAFGFALFTASGERGYGMLYTPLLHLPLAFAFMMLRDACIVLFFSFSPRAKRPGAVALLYLAVLDWLLPYLFDVIGLGALSFFLFPMLYDHGNAYGATTGVLAMASQAVIALGLVAWRLQKAKQAGTA